MCAHLLLSYPLPYTKLISLPAEQDDERVASFEVDEPRAAMICHDAGGSLYFRSPQAMVNPWVGRLSAELGLNFGAVYSQPAAGPGALPQKGEIEVFATRAGHVTDWHTDFMENFTLQLRGKKRWRIARSGLEGPIRGYTPHYKSVDNLTQQLKLHRMQNPRFPAPAPWDDGSDNDVVELGPGDFLYHPAGVWHRVECTEDSLSMNISLIGLSWADHIADATRHAMWRHSSLRAPVLVRPSNYSQARADAEQRLGAARRQLAGLTGEDVMPPCLLLPRYDGEWIVGSTGDGRRLLLAAGDDMEEQGSEDEDAEEQDEDAEDAEDGGQQEERDEEADVDEEESFLSRGEDEADAAWTSGTSQLRIRINPLAVLLRSGEEENTREQVAGQTASSNANNRRSRSRPNGDDDDSLAADTSDEDHEENEDAGGLLYVCHVMFGNEEVGSAVETHIRYDTAHDHSFFSCCEHQTASVLIRMTCTCCRVDECFGPFLDYLSGANSSAHRTDQQEFTGVLMQLNARGITGPAGSSNGAQPLPEGVCLGGAPLQRLWRVLRYAGFCRHVQA